MTIISNGFPLKTEANSRHLKRMTKQEQAVKIVILGSERLLSESDRPCVEETRLGIRLGLDPGIQNLLKTMDSRLRENDGQKQKWQFIHRL